jgi:nitrite reductase/ring-hydroxylating ferredoxin subunit
VVGWIKVAKTEDVVKDTIKLGEAAGKKIALVNVEGRYYAFEDRCPHMNAPLHMGFLSGKILTCPLHFSTFDVTTGKKLTDPDMTMPPEMMKKFPQELIKMFSRMAEIMAKVETYDLKTFEAKVESGSISVKIE